MSNQVAQQVEEIFSDKEQWDSFLEICKNKDNIKGYWFSKFREKINEQFAINNISDSWGFSSWGIWDFKWFIKEFGRESLGIWYQGNSFYLSGNGNLYDGKQIFNMLQESKYTPIVSAFDRQDEIPSVEANANIRIVERGNFYFGEYNDGYLDTDQLAWYAHYKTDDFVKQLIEKVDRFRKSEEITELLFDINMKTKKK